MSKFTKIKELTFSFLGLFGLLRYYFYLEKRIKALEQKEHKP